LGLRVKRERRKRDRSLLPNSRVAS
jgi:hypothetical protein